MSSKNVVISGGTDGIGKALGLEYLRRGDRVAIIGRTTAKGAAFLDEAAALGASGRAHFIAADLSLVAETRVAIDAVRDRFDQLDALVLGARHVRTERHVTQEGFESTFALYYLSRFLLSHELAGARVIVNVSGPGETGGEPPWGNLELANGYTMPAALSLGGRLNDLLAVGWGQRHSGSGARYVLVHPGVVATAFSGTYDEATTAAIEQLRRTGMPVAQAIRPIVPLIDDPPAEPVSAWVQGRPFAMSERDFSPAAARKLDELTQALLRGQ